MEIRKETGIRQALDEPLTEPERVEMKAFVLDVADGIVCDSCKQKVLEVILGKTQHSSSTGG